MVLSNGKSTSEIAYESAKRKIEELERILRSQAAARRGRAEELSENTVRLERAAL
jgi:hypothetical protein